MNRIMVVTGMIVAMFLAIVGCTEQERAKNFGGSTTVELPEGKKTRDGYVEKLGNLVSDAGYERRRLG